MSRIFIVINLTGFVFYFVGCKNIATESSSPTRKPGNSILWEISSESSPLKSFLYGTIHIQDKRVFSFDAIVQNSFQNADILAVEIELDRIDFATIMEVTTMKDSTLKQLLAPDEYELLEKRYKEITGASLQSAQMVKPFFLSSNVVKELSKSDYPIPLDLYFIKQARQHGKTVVGLETLEEQVSLIDRLSYSEQARMLLKSLADTVDIQQQFDQLLEVYLAMDGDSLLKIVSSDPSIPEEFMIEMLHARNVLMANRLEKLLKGHSVFCAVGAAHLFGDTGIIELLRQKGFVLRPVEFEFIQQ
ncbi:MAG TPA: TraB/GumN family protein [Salinivirgaceae bacterium]|nr:TraB/GumN family protein [Salinivirgaceae bacterium]